MDDHVAPDISSADGDGVARHLDLASAVYDFARHHDPRVKTLRWERLYPASRAHAGPVWQFGRLHGLPSDDKISTTAWQRVPLPGEFSAMRDPLSWSLPL